MKNVRLIVSSLAAIAALTATSGLILSAQEASAQTVSTSSVNWSNVTIPGQLCQVNGPIQLHNGHATVRHSGFGMALDVFATNVIHGNLGPGFPVTAFQVWCDNTGGTADGQLAQGIMVFDSPGGHPHFLGTLTPQHKTSAMLHIPFIAVNHIKASGRISVTEFFYNGSNATCCPSGRATTIWQWTGHKFIPGHTSVTHT